MSIEVTNEAAKVRLTVLGAWPWRAIVGPSALKGFVIEGLNLLPRRRQETNMSAVANRWFALVEGAVNPKLGELFAIRDNTRMFHDSLGAERLEYFVIEGPRLFKASGTKGHMRDDRWWFELRHP